MSKCVPAPVLDQAHREFYGYTMSHGSPVWKTAENVMIALEKGRELSEECLCDQCMAAIIRSSHTIKDRAIYTRLVNRTVRYSLRRWPHLQFYCPVAVEDFDCIHMPDDIGVGSWWSELFTAIRQLG